MAFDVRTGTITLGILVALLLLGCGPRLAPRIEVPADQTDQTAYRDAYTAFWWNCAIVKSLDLTARCPSTCGEPAAATAACSAGAMDAQNQIAELEKKYGPERTREFLSFRVGEEEGHAKIRPHFPYGPQREK
jgi:hypothetical protein